MNSPEVSVVVLCSHLAKSAPYGSSKFIPPAFFLFLVDFLFLFFSFLFCFRRGEREFPG